MKQTVKLLIGFFTILTTNGCSEKFLVYEDCSTPDVQKPIIDKSKKSNILDLSKQCAKNYLVVSEYAVKLEKANETCK